MFYRVILRIARIVLWFLFRIRYEGRENVPKEGGAILAVNHKSNWDVIVASLACPRQLRFMAKAELFENKLFGRFIKALGAFPIHRGAADISAVKAALGILKHNDVMLMFPEGHRIKKNEAHHAKHGVAMIAQRAQVPVIPTYISGDYRWMGKIKVRFGEPITFSEYYGQKLDRDQLQELSDSVLHVMYSMAEEQKRKDEAVA